MKKIIGIIIAVIIIIFGYLIMTARVKTHDEMVEEQAKREGWVKENGIWRDKEGKMIYVAPPGEADNPERRRFIAEQEELMRKRRIQQDEKYREEVRRGKR